MSYNNQLVNQQRKLATKITNEELYPKVIAGDVAVREEMVVNNMPLVLYLVEVYLKHFPDFSYLRDDLVGEGLLGLAKAIDWMEKNKVLFDEMNCATFMSKTIRHQIIEYFKNEVHLESLEEQITAGPPAKFEDEFIEDVLSCCYEEERPIIELWLGGNSERDIAEKLNLSENTDYKSKPEIYVHRIIEVVKSRIVAKYDTGRPRLLNKSTLFEITGEPPCTN